MRAILTYHSVDESGSPISIGAEAFRRHVDWLASGPVRVVSLEQLVRNGEGGSEADPDQVAITFDDGFANFATRAAPLLLERGLPVTLFVVTSHVGGNNAWGGRPGAGVPELELLSWDALGRLAEQGVVLGSHTRTHPRLSDLEARALDDELLGSADHLARELGIRPRWLAYPYGAVSGLVAAAARRQYAGAVTTEYRMLGRREDLLRLPRLDAFYFRDQGLARWGGPSFRGGVWLRRQARRARAALAWGQR